MPPGGPIPHLRDEVEIPFRDEIGRTVATLRLWSVRENTLAEFDEPFPVLTDADGERYEYLRVQLLEGCRYEYTLTWPEGGCRGLVLRSSTVLPRRGDPMIGMIEPGNYTGILPLTLVDVDGTRIAEAAVEVQSAKAGSVRHYRQMVEDITEECATLLLQLRSPARLSLELRNTGSPDALTQRFYFLNSLLDSRRFREALSRILRNPHIRSEGEETEVAVRRGGVRLGPREVRQLVGRQPRIPLPSSHPLSVRVPALRTVAERVTAIEHRDSLDTPENRFVKHALQTFDHTLEDMERLLRGSCNAPGTDHVVEEIKRLRERLDDALGHAFFRQLSRPDMLPLGSPVLQRREGYREILRAWLQLNLAARLVWRGGEDVFRAGKRDVATLYEYWLFFKLHACVGQVFTPAAGLMDGEEPDDPLVERSEDGFELRLAAGRRHSRRLVHCVDGTPALRVRFCYNRQYGKTDPESCPAIAPGTPGRTAVAGSWTMGMRPDYSLSLWPHDMTEAEAEAADTIVHLHFDAKYRVVDPMQAAGKAASIVDLFSGDAQDDRQAIDGVFGEADDVCEPEAGSESEVASRTSKRADLLKMHAYRDAIRRTEGAYILYPGSRGCERHWRGYHELLPGLGAFAVCPGSADDMANVRDFLSKAADLCVDRFSQLRRRKYWVHETVREAPAAYAGPAPADGRPPADVAVMLGYVRKKAIPAVKEHGIFYWYAVKGGRPEKLRYADVLRARYLVPYQASHVHSSWVGWYAEIATVELMAREELLVYPGVGLALKSREDVEYYYVVRLARDAAGAVRVHHFDNPPPHRPPRSTGGPSCSSWAELWALPEAGS